MLSHVELLLQQGQAAQALSLLEQYTASNPQDPHAWFLLGIASHQSRKFPEALQALEHVLSLAPNHQQARNIKAIVLCELDRPQEALQIYRETLRLAPGDVSLLLNMAIVLEQIGDTEEALKQYDQAIEHQPDLLSAMLNRGALLLRLGRKQEALDNNLHLVAAHPESADAQFNLGETHLALDHWEAALSAYTQALAQQPDLAKAHFGSGLALSMLRRFDEANQAFAKAQTLDPDICIRSMLDAANFTGGEMREFSPQTIYLLKEAQGLMVCDWSKRKALSLEFENQIEHHQNDGNALSERTLMFPTFSLPLTQARRFLLARNIASQIAERVKISNSPAFTFSAAHSGKIKIGYVSPDFRKHPVAILSRRLFTLHDRNKFEIYGYSLHPDDGSQVRTDIEQGCDVFRELSSLNDRSAAEIIHRDGIDILVDLAGYTTFARSEIFAMQPSPLQLCYLGFQYSTGADYMDYFMADPVILPSGMEKYFSEKIAYLPDSYSIFDNQQTNSPLSLNRKNQGLPEEALVFCCHNNNYKITPEVFDSWMRILQQVPGSVLWLLKSNEQVLGNLRKEAELRGIAAERLIFAEFVPNEIHLARYRLADLFLDTFLCNAITTASEALWAGLPVLTCTGESMLARAAACMLSAVSLHELITATQEQYEEKAIYLATHPDELARVRALLERNRLSAPLFNTERQVKNIEDIYQHIWHRYKAGLPPETFHIKK